MFLLPEKALADHNYIWGTIKTGTNQDGRTAKPITAPSAVQQMALLKYVYEKNGVDPRDIQYIEAHGKTTVCLKQVAIH